MFRNKVLPLEQTAGLTELPSAEVGRIYMFNSWQVPLVEGTAIDLFWNAASFNEMQPDLVDNYLSFVRPTAKSLYLMSIMESPNHAVGMAEYESSLPQHRCEDVRPLTLPTGKVGDPYRNSIWRRLTDA